VRTIAIRVTPDFHAQLTVVAQVDDVSLTDLMMTALETHVEARRQAPDFKAKVQAALTEAEAQMARTRAMLLGATAPTEAASNSSPSDETPAEEAKPTRRKG
jgi:hypothetical protein